MKVNWSYIWTEPLYSMLSRLSSHLYQQPFCLLQKCLVLAGVKGH